MWLQTKMELSTKQKEFWNEPPHRWNIKTGATRSGKTWLDYYMIPKRIRALENKEGDVLLLGTTRSTFDRNVLEPMRKLYGDLYVGHTRRQLNHNVWKKMLCARSGVQLTGRQDTWYECCILLWG